MLDKFECEKIIFKYVYIWYIHKKGLNIYEHTGMKKYLNSLDMSIMITSNERPFKIIAVNECWKDMFSIKSKVRGEIPSKVFNNDFNLNKFREMNRITSNMLMDDLYDNNYEDGKNYVFWNKSGINSMKVYKIGNNMLLNVCKKCQHFSCQTEGELSI